MKTLIIGAGNVGTAIAFYLTNISSESISLLDSDERALEKFKLKFKKFNLTKINYIKQNILSVKYIDKFIKRYEIVISTLPWEQHVNLCKILEKSQIIIIGIARPNYDYYHGLYKNNRNIKATIIHGCGLEPGLTEIFTQYLVNPFNKLNKVSIACGGIPMKPVPPLNYKLLFGGDNLPFQQRKTLKIDNGKIISVTRFGEVDEFVMDSLGILECWNDGLTPWLAEYLVKMGVITCIQKTIRWPGYAKIIEFLHQAGFLADENIEITNKILLPKLQLAAYEIDTVMQRIHVKGLIKNQAYEAYLEFIDYKDSETGLTAMARSTGFTTALIAQVIWEERNNLSGEHMITDCYSEELFDHLYSQLKNIGIRIDITFEKEIENVSKI